MEPTRVLYNANCPICRAEVAHYATRAKAAGALLTFEDLNATDLTAWQLTPDQAKRRIHAQLPCGTRVSGMAAFAAIWDQLPHMGWLARAARLPGVSAATKVLYNHVAAPALYRLHRRRERLGKAPPPP